MKLILFGMMAVLLLPNQPTLASFPQPIIKVCVKTVNVKAIDLALFYGTDMQEVSKPVKCYLTCIFESSGFILDGEVSPDLIDMSKLRESAEQSPIFGMIDACQNVKSTVECEMGYALFKCFMDYTRKQLMIKGDDNKEL